MTASGCLCQPTAVHEGSKRAIIAALLANFGIAVLKFIGWIVTQSASLLAECVHSMADTGNQALLLFGGHRATRKATPTHPFGYGRERYFWSFIVAQVLFLLGGAFAIYEGIEKLRHPHEPESLWWAVGILVGAIVFEGFSFRTAVHEIQAGEGPVVLLQLHPPLEVARAAGGAPGGLRVRSSASSSRCSAWSCPRSPTTAAGTRWDRCPSACCCASSPSSWPSR